MCHPLVASFSAAGNYDGVRLGEGFVHAILRRGNASSAEGAVRFVRETIRRSRGLACHLDVRIDAGLVEGKVLDAIDEEGARQRRQKIVRESEFYGAMDGASKFIRGDAIAGLVITAINLVGGFVVGMSGGLGAREALTVGYVGAQGVRC